MPDPRLRGLTRAEALRRLRADLAGTDLLGALIADRRREAAIDDAEAEAALRGHPPDPDWARELAELRGLFAPEDRWPDEHDHATDDVVGPSGDG